ncbi:hypothetical protein AAVH_32601 [Aphelenchoides avenae]|nr:hypothetical protein AAVH_32601 [Aphelenchus avenae]
MERAVSANRWLADHRTAIERILSEFVTASSLEAVFEAMVNETGYSMQVDGFHGVVLLRNWAFFGPAELHLAIHSPTDNTTQLWGNVWYADNAKWTTRQAHTISVIFLV